MKLTILVADDETLECDAFEFLAMQSGIECHCIKVKNGKEAVEKAREIRPQLIILDIQMPVMNGLEAAEEIRKFLPEVMIVFLTAWGRFDFAQKALRLKANDYLVKPIEQEGVTNLLKKCTEKLKNESQKDSTGSELLNNAKIQNATAKLKEVILKGNTEEVLQNEQKLLESIYSSFSDNAQSSAAISNVITILNYSIGKEIPFLEPPDVNSKNLSYLETQLANFCLSAVKAALQDKKDKYERIFSLIFQYIETHYMEELDTENLCEKFSLHPGYFPQLFRKYSDTTFIEYLTKIRLFHAAKYLKEGNSVKEAANKSGFQDTNYFSKVFRKHFNCSPSEYPNQ